LLDVETSLHRELKLLYSAEGALGVEVRRDGFRADAIGPGGEWVEIQSGPLGALRAKLDRLLQERAVRVVKPMVLERRIVRLDRPGAVEQAPRKSPYRGRMIQAFDELVSLMRVFPHPNLKIEVLGVAVDEVRLISPRRRKHVVLDRRLRNVVETVHLNSPDDLWRLLPDIDGSLRDPFTTLELQPLLGRGLDFAQRVAYCLRMGGAVRLCGHRKRHRLYERTARARASTAVCVPVMIDLIKRVLYTGVGVASLTREKLVELGQEISRHADLTESQAKDLEDELLSKGEEARNQLEAQIDRRVEQVLQRLGVAREHQLSALAARVAELERELAAAETPIPREEGPLPGGV
jgi:polyhydroxyalkanoate synthesis regulator phasin